MLQEFVDSVAVGVGQFIVLALGMGGSWVGQFTSFLLPSIPGQALQHWLTQSSLQQKEAVLVLLLSGPQIWVPSLILPGPALLFCPSKVQGPLSLL